MKDIAKLAAQIIALVFGVLTATGVSTDPAIQNEIQAQTGNLINALAGIAIIVTTLVGSIKSVWDQIRAKQ